MENIKNQEFYKHYKYDLEELQRIKIDLTFIEVSQKQIQNTKNSLEWAKNTLTLHPEIKSVIHILKRYLQIKKLNSSFNGNQNIKNIN